MSQTLVDTDQRGRASLGKPNQRYLMREEADGTLVLEPAVVMTELEHRFLLNTALRAQIAEAREHPERQVPRQRRRLA